MDDHLRFTAAGPAEVAGLWHWLLEQARAWERTAAHRQRLGYRDDDAHATARAYHRAAEELRARFGVGEA